MRTPVFVVLEPLGAIPGTTPLVTLAAADDWKPVTEVRDGAPFVRLFGVASDALKLRDQLRAVRPGTQFRVGMAWTRIEVFQEVIA